MIDSTKRSMTKSLTWKFLGFTILSVITYLTTGSLEQTGAVAVLYHLFMWFLFVFHEKVWNKVDWGKTTGLYIQMTGMSGAGKTTIARGVEKRLKSRGIQVEIIDGDVYRQNVCRDLGFSREDRNENIRRLSFIGGVLGRNNVVCIMSAINPYEETREQVRKNIENSKLVYVKCNLDELKARDTKGLYKRALLPDGHADKVYNFTGISDPFDEPAEFDLEIDTDNCSEKEAINKLEKYILKQIGE